MSGGHFDYIQFRIQEAFEQLRDGCLDECGIEHQITKDRIMETQDMLELAYKMLQQVDLFYSGDNGEESFNKMWMKEIVGNKRLQIAKE